MGQIKRKLAACLSSLALFAGVQGKAESFSFLENLCAIGVLSLFAWAPVYEAYNIPHNLIEIGYKDCNKVDLIIDTLLGISGGFATVAVCDLIYGYNDPDEETHERHTKDVQNREKKGNTNDEQSPKLNETPHSS